MWRLALTVVLILAGQLVLGDDLTPAVPPPGAPAGPTLGQGGFAPTQPPSPYATAWPPSGQLAPVAPGNNVGGQASWLVPGDRGMSPPVVPAPAACVVSPAQSTWYYRLDNFSWNERDSTGDLVNEHGPLSTLGYMRQSGIERFRIELFGGTVAYDGSAEYQDQNGQWQDEPYHQSFGTNYLGCRGEYELLLEPAAWSRARLFVGVGTRFWIRNLQDAITPSGAFSSGYDETWWTFYPYVGLETKDSDEPGMQFFGSVRVGATPLTYQHDTYYDVTAWPQCGITGQLEGGVRYRRFSLSAFVEVMTWGASASATVIDGYGNQFFVCQPDSRMLTLGGKLGYTF